MDDKANDVLEVPVNRAKFLRKAAGIGLAAGVGLMALSAFQVKIAKAQSEGKDELFIMNEEIKKAIKNPAVRWGMLIDLRRCTACKACTVGCIAEQKSPPGIMYRPVYEEESGTYPDVKRRFIPRLCNQCDKPPCVEVCPKTGVATWKNEKGPGAGIVMIDYMECIGCGRCVKACPYKARALDAGAFYTEGTPFAQEYEKLPSWEYGKKWHRAKGQRPEGRARKCHFCVHRLQAGMLPMCVNTCVCRANFFGDTSDSSSLISLMLQENKSRIKVLESVKGFKDGDVPADALKGVKPVEIAPKIGYPGKVPVFADSAETQPRVFYILP